MVLAMWRPLKSVLIGFALILGARAKCDSWASPQRKESFSKNSNFVAIIQPGSKTNSPTATVFRVNPTGRTQLWQAKLSNPSAPSSALLSDDGKYLVTLNDWARVGYGSNVVALYKSTRQTRKYSLEEFAPPPLPEPEPLAERLKATVEGWIHGPSPKPGVSLFAYQGLFPHSTSSRWWNSDSIQFFWPSNSPTHFCLWIDWKQQWAAWDLENGKLVAPSDRLIKEWNNEGRSQCLQRIELHPKNGAELNFLGRLRMKEDRALIEKRLKDTNFFTGSMQSSSGNNEQVRFVYQSYSQTRERADQILARWDGMTNRQPYSHEGYMHLGSIRGFIHLPAQPKKSDGFLRLQLVPESENRGIQWEITAHYLIADLENSRPTIYMNGKSTELPFGTNIEFAIYGVTPGDYRVQALWDKSAPNCAETNLACQATRGDFVSKNPPLVQIRKGQITEKVSVDCASLVE